MSLIRIDKYLSVACGVSRTEAKLMLKSGKVVAEGKPITKADSKVDEAATVSLSGQILTYKKYIYIVMNKPAGILSASSDKRVKTVVDILPESLKRDGLFPVGRLDKDTTGLLIITDDGDFGHKVTSPKSHINKCYYAELDGKVTDEAVELFAKGVTLVSGEECKPAKLERVGETAAKITICEGKYHQIKRMFGVVGLGVTRLHRLSIADFTLPENLALGEARELTEEEKLKILVDLNK